jgi:hypothetical protein
VYRKDGRCISSLLIRGAEILEIRCVNIFSDLVRDVGDTEIKVGKVNFEHIRVNELELRRELSSLKATMELCNKSRINLNCNNLAKFYTRKQQSPSLLSRAALQLNFRNLDQFQAQCQWI